MPQHPTRRSFLGGAALGAAAWQRPAGGPPNIIFIITDDQRWDTLRGMGNPVIETPHLDRLAAGGVLFTSHFVATAVCQASRASMLSGLYLGAHKLIDDGDSLSLPVFAQTFPALLRKAGYRTAFFGKWHFGARKPFPKEELFDVYEGFFGQGRYFLESGGKTVHLTRYQGDQAVEFLRGSASRQPFCLVLSFKAPHPQERGRPYHGEFLNDPAHDHLYRDVTIPYPKTYDPRYFERLPGFMKNSELRLRFEDLFSTPEKYQRSMKGYYRLVSGVDEQVGRIRRTLDELGLAGNTVLMHTGDNGYFFGDHGLADKSLMYEESIRTPLVVYDPRLAAGMRGRRLGGMSVNVDIAPTILDLAGVPVPPSMQGRSLRPLLYGARTPWRRDWIYQHPFDYGGTIPKSEGIRTERWKYIRYPGVDPVYEELFDLERDRHETENLARSAAHRGTLETLRARWKNWNDAVDAWRLDRPWTEPPPG